MPEIPFRRNRQAGDKGEEKPKEPMHEWDSDEPRKRPGSDKLRKSPGDRDNYSSDDDRSHPGLSRPGGSYHTVQRYRVTPSRAEEVEDDRRSRRLELPRGERIEVDRRVERYGGEIDRPRSAIDIGYDSPLSSAESGIPHFHSRAPRTEASANHTAEHSKPEEQALSPMASTEADLPPKKRDIRNNLVSGNYTGMGSPAAPQNRVTESDISNHQDRVRSGLDDEMQRMQVSMNRMGLENSDLRQETEALKRDYNEIKHHLAKTESENVKLGKVNITLEEERRSFLAETQRAKDAERSLEDKVIQLQNEREEWRNRWERSEGRIHDERARLQATKNQLATVQDVAAQQAQKAEGDLKMSREELHLTKIEAAMSREKMRKELEKNHSDKLKVVENSLDREIERANNAEDEFAEARKTFLHEIESHQRCKVEFEQERESLEKGLEAVEETVTVLKNALEQAKMENLNTQRDLQLKHQEVIMELEKGKAEALKKSQSDFIKLQASLKAKEKELEEKQDAYDLLQKEYRQGSEEVDRMRTLLYENAYR